MSHTMNRGSGSIVLREPNARINNPLLQHHQQPLVSPHLHHPILTEIDVFKAKIHKILLERHFPEYTGGPDINKAAKFILGRIMQENRARLSVYPHVEMHTHILSTCGNCPIFVAATSVTCRIQPSRVDHGSAMFNSPITAYNRVLFSWLSSSYESHLKCHLQMNAIVHRVASCGPGSGDVWSELPVTVCTVTTKGLNPILEGSYPMMVLWDSADTQYPLNLLMV
ncbi:hypothetical protein B0H14DRAFT_2634279 [Mycena olivaceomarginata]|nr:hypothetical protein B0H14DRAFT_2634279 [Mycena olivaceomarginata]